MKYPKNLRVLRKAITYICRDIEAFLEGVKKVTVIPGNGGYQYR